MAGRFEPRLRRTRYLTACALVSVCLAPISRAQEDSTTKLRDAASSVAPQVVIIPDGTVVEMRFTQSVRGKIGTFRGALGEAKPGDKVGLVAADDVRVNQLVVIAKGAVGQATVTDVSMPAKVHTRSGGAMELPETGLSLQLDWIGDITGQQVPLRASPNGESKPFIVEVLSQRGGMVARPDSLRRSLIQSATLAYLVTMAHQRNWIPTGTRIRGYVRGAVTFALAEVKQAQALLPIPNATAMLTIYRTKSHDGDQPTLVCDDKEVVSIGARQYVTLELAPGKHNCRADGQKPLEVTAAAGDEYFVQLRYRTLTGNWELKRVTTAEGEDGIAKSEVAGKR